jgi:hypothetical protein
MRSHYEIQLHGMVRYTAVLFPTFMALALLFRGGAPHQRIVRSGYIVVGIGLQIWLITLFAAWLWVS